MAHRHRFNLGVCNCGLRQTGERLFSDTPRANRQSRLWCADCRYMLNDLKEKAEHDRQFHKEKALRASLLNNEMTRHLATLSLEDIAWCATTSPHVTVEQHNLIEALKKENR